MEYTSFSKLGRLIYGPAHMGQESVSSLTVHGPAVLSGTEVTEKTEINGTLEANKASLNHLTVNGSMTGKDVRLFSGRVSGAADLERVTARGTLIIYGYLKAVDCEFKERVIIDSVESSFISCKVFQIVIQDSSASFPKQTIYLKDKCRIYNSITFLSGKGEIIATADSDIEEKQVTGGKIIRV